MSAKRWKEEIIELGVMGRHDNRRVEKYEDLDLDCGLYRLEGTESVKVSKEYAISHMKKAGLEIRFDRVGNIYGRKEGTAPDAKAVMAGSHLDSVLNGGMFDGVVGVISALEAVRIMNDEGFKNERPIEVAVFFGEEGSAFKKGLLGSDVAVGKLPVDEALALTNADGIVLGAALKKAGFYGDFMMDLSSIEYFIEIHVEQGPVLDREKVSLGVVENITGITWVTATIEGEENHAGTTPMNMRHDPLVAASEIVLLANRRAKELVKRLKGSTVATVGKLHAHPGAPNIIPGKVDIGIDIRDGIERNMKDLREEVIDAIKEAEKKHGVKATYEIPIDHSPCPCSAEVVEALQEAARESNIDAKKMNSGAGHDAQNIAEKVKTGMLFVPSVNGISHSPMEWTDWEDIEKGIRVLSNALKKLSFVS